MTLKQLKRILISVIAFVLVTSCEQPPPSPPIPTRDKLASNKVPPIGFGAYGYLLLSQRPKVLQSSREYAFCRAYLRSLEPTSLFKNYPREKIMPTYWLVDTPAVDDASCERLVENYDYARATVMRSAVGKLGYSGPMLVAWRVPFEKAEGQQALVLDLSRIREEQFSEVLGVWSSRITRLPEVWENGFRIERVRLEFKAFLLEYGDTIVSVVDWIKGAVS